MNPIQTESSIFLASKTILAGVALLATAICAPRALAQQPPAASARQRSREIRSFGDLPLSFEPNVGQAAARVRFLARGSGYEVLLTRKAAVLALMPAARTNTRLARPASHAPALNSTVVSMRLAGAAPSTIRGDSPLPGTVNYIAGSDRARWKTGIATFSRVRYTSVYPGIDLVFHGSASHLEYDFDVGPGARPDAIRMRFTAPVRLDRRGNLVLSGAGKIAFRRPLLYQMVNGRRVPVPGGFRLAGRHTVGFMLGRYNRALPLVIDPVLDYSTYLAGSSLDQILAMAVDLAGNTYVTGNATSCNFPITPGAYQSNAPNCLTAGGPGNFFVSKLNPQGTALVYSAYVAGFGSQSIGWAIAVDANGDAYVGGAASAGLPVTPGAFQTTDKAAAVGAFNGYLFELNPVGSNLLYATYLGGSSGETIYGVALDGAGNAYVAGVTYSSDFPATPGAFQSKYTNPTVDLPTSFAAKFNPDGTQLLYATYITGTNDGAPNDSANAIAVDSSGDAYVVGQTTAQGFPVTSGAFQMNYCTRTGPYCNLTGYIVKLNPAGSQEVYASYLGGSMESQAEAVAVDSSGSAYVTGGTTGGNATTQGAFETVAPGHDAYVVKVDPTGDSLTYATYLGGSCQDTAQVQGDTGYSIAIDGSGDAYVAGQTCSVDFPVTNNAVQSTIQGANSQNQASSAFFSELNPAGGQLLFSTYLGGSSMRDSAKGVGLDAQGNAYIAGTTNSTSFPVTTGAFQTKSTADASGFIAKFTVPAGGQVVQHDFSLALNPSAATISPGGTATGTITITPVNGFYEPINLSCSGTPNWANCNISNPVITPDGSAATTTLTVTTSTQYSRTEMPGRTVLPAFSLAALAAWFGLRRRRFSLWMCLILLAGATLLNGCGGIPSHAGNIYGPFRVVVTAASTTEQHSTAFSVTMQ